jgi:hypothetical protein
MSEKSAEEGDPSQILQKLLRENQGFRIGSLPVASYFCLRSTVFRIFLSMTPIVEELDLESLCHLFFSTDVSGAELFNL